MFEYDGNHSESNDSTPTYKLVGNSNERKAEGSVSDISQIKSPFMVLKEKVSSNMGMIAGTPFNLDKKKEDPKIKMLKNNFAYYGSF